LDNLTISKDILYENSRKTKDQQQNWPQRKNTDSHWHHALKELLNINEKANKRRYVEKDDLVRTYEIIDQSFDKKLIANPHKTFTKFGEKNQLKINLNAKPSVSYRSSIDHNKSPIDTLNNSQELVAEVDS
jgi:hypothetical protein